MRVLLAVLLLASFLAPVVPAAAQSDDPEDYGFVDDDRWMGKVFDTEVTFDPDAWIPQLGVITGSFPAKGEEYVSLLSDEGIGLLQVIAFEPDDDAGIDDFDDAVEWRQGLRDEGFPGTEIVESDSEDGLGWYTFYVPYADGDFFVLAEITEDDGVYLTREIVVAPDDVEALADLAAETVEVNGDPAFGNHYTARAIDRLDLGRYVDTGPDDDSADDDGAADDDDRDADDDSDIDSDDSADDGSAADDDDSDIDGDDSADGDTGALLDPALGFTDAGTWVSPTFGTIVTWTDDWTPALDVTSVSSTQDRLSLDSVSKYVDIFAFDARGYASMDAYIEAVLAERAEQFAAADVVTLESVSGTIESSGESWGAFAYAFDFDGERWVGIAEVFSVGNIFVTTTLTSSLDSLPDALEAANATITVDSLIPFGYRWSADTIPTDDTPLSTAAPDEVAPGDEDVALGLIAPGTWQGVTFGTTVTWTDAWTVTANAIETGPRYDYLLIEQPGMIFETFSFDGNEFADMDAFLVDRLAGEATDYSESDFALLMADSGQVADSTESWAGYAYTYTSGGQIWIAVAEVYSQGAIYVISLVHAPVGSLPDAFTTAMETVEVDGLDPFGYMWSLDTLPTGDEPAIELPVAAAVAEDPDDAPAEVIWESELYGAQVSCTSNWAVDPTNSFIDTDTGVEGVDIASNPGLIILTLAQATNADLPTVLNIHRDVIADQYAWEDLTEIDNGGEEGFAEWAAFAGTIDGETRLMVVEATWYDADAEVAQITQYTATVDVFQDGFGAMLDQCGIDGYYLFTHYDRDTILDLFAVVPPIWADRRFAA